LALNGWVLALFGYQSGQVSDLAMKGIILVSGPLPLLWYLLGLFILRKYPTDQPYYEKMLEKKEVR
jgi:GPH family glycoside/pentoside/hexuronide:cation symporter